MTLWFLFIIFCYFVYQFLFLTSKRAASHMNIAITENRKKVNRFWMAFNGITRALLHCYLPLCASFFLLCLCVVAVFDLLICECTVHTRIRITQTIIIVCLVMRSLFAACSWNVHFLPSFSLRWLSNPLWKRFPPVTSKFHFLTNGEFRGNVVSFANHVERLSTVCCGRLRLWQSFWQGNASQATLCG